MYAQAQFAENQPVAALERPTFFPPFLWSFKERGPPEAKGVERRESSGRSSDDEPMMAVDELAQAAVLMATLPPHVNMLEAIVLPVGQLYIGRG